MSDVPERYRSICEGDGVTCSFCRPSLKDQYVLPNLPDGIGFIGTYSSRACVGVYIKLDAKRCFMAHINAYARTRPDDVGEHLLGAIWGRRINSLEGWQLYDRVLARLRQEALENEWPPLRTLQNAVVNCPVQHLWDGKPLTGAYVLQALRSFLIRPNLMAGDDEAFLR